MFRFTDLIILLISLFSTSQAFAYTPPTGFILNQMLKEREGVKQLYFEGKVNDLKSKAVFKESLYLDFLNGRGRETLTGPNEEVLASNLLDLKNLHLLGKFWIGVGLDSNGLRFKKALDELNALPREKSVADLSRLGKKVTWSWGEVNKIQFYKDDFLAAGYQTGSGETLDQIELEDYTAVGSAVRVPKTVLIKSKGQDVFRFELLKMKVNAVMKFQAPETPAMTPASIEWINLVR